MDDFYVTIPYGLVVLGGGVAGYVKRGSAASLAAGVGFGSALLLAGAISVWAFTRGRSSFLFATVLQTVCAVALTTIMAIRYMKTRKVMPSGIIATIRIKGSRQGANTNHCTLYRKFEHTVFTATMAFLQKHCYGGHNDKIIK